MNLKKYEKRVERLEAETKLKQAEEEIEVRHEKVFNSVMKELFRNELDKEDLENIKLVEEDPKEYLLADIFHKMSSNVKSKKNE